jgi:type IV pilus assembly protein PilV
MNMIHTKIQQTGSVLLEALIAILIFSIGILALVGMQATAISTVADAKYRSTAGFLANQMVGVMWATRLASASAASVSNVTVSGPDPTFACDPCNAVTGNGFTQGWVESIGAELPNPTASIAIAGPAVTIQLTWQPPEAGSSVPPHRHIVTTVIN